MKKRGDHIWNENGEIVSAVEDAIMAPLKKAGVSLFYTIDEKKVDKEIQKLVYDVYKDAGDSDPYMSYRKEGLTLTYYIEGLEQVKTKPLESALLEILTDIAQDDWDETGRFDTIAAHLQTMVDRVIKKARKKVVSNGHPFTYNRRRSAAKIVTDFQRYVENATLAGSGHPELVEWHQDRLRIAKERMVRRLTGDSRPTEYMPRQPDVEY